MTHFDLIKALSINLNVQDMNGMTHFGINLNVRDMNGMTHFDFVVLSVKIYVRLLYRYSRVKRGM